MRSLFSITVVTLRNVARSKLAIALALFLAVLTVGLPFSFSGDGTRLGQARIAILYTLSIAMLLLSFASVWMSAASLSSDVRTRTLQLVRVKPVRMCTLWLGKWLAFLILDALLLAGVLALLCGRVAIKGNRSFFTSARHEISPTLISIEDQIDLTYQRAIAGQNFSRKERAALKAQIKEQIPFATATLARGDEWKWNFDLPRPIRKNERLLGRMRFDSDAMTRDQITAECSLQSKEKGASVPFRITSFSSREISIPLDVSPLAGSQHLTLSIKHTGAEGSGPLMLQPRQNLVLLQEASSFFSNLSRAYLILLSILAVLIAIGLSFGALFTLPVAVFCSVGFILSVLIGHYAATDPDVLSMESDGPEPIATVITRGIAIATSRTLTFISQPALAPRPIGELSNGIWISGHDLHRALLLNLLLFPGLFAILVSIPLSRKELPE